MIEDLHEHAGQSKTIAEWAHLLDIDARELASYVRDGDTIEDAITECLDSKDREDQSGKFGLVGFRTATQNIARKRETLYTTAKRHLQIGQPKTAAEWAKAHRPRRS